MVITAYHPIIGGAERQAKLVAEELSKIGYTVSVITMRKSPDIPSREVINGVHILRFGLGENKINLITFLFSTFLYLLIRKKEIDLIHVHQASYVTGVVAIASCIRKMRWVAKLSNSGIKFDFKELKSRSFGSIFLWFVKKKCNKFIAITSNIQKELLQAGIPRGKIEVIPNGVSVSKSISNNLRKSDLDCAKDDIVFVQVSRLTDVKNHKMIISAASKIRQKNFKILFIGDGPNRDIIKYKIDELNMGNNIKLIGSKQNIDEYYQISDVFLLPSIAEGLSNALLEACVHGLYPIVSNLAGNREVLVSKNKQLGLLLDPLDENVWVESMSNICKNGICLRFENESIINRYLINNVVQRICHLYSKVI